MNPDEPRPTAAALVKQALFAFEAAMREADDDALWYLHGALEKHPEVLLRGDWGRTRGNDEILAAGCPLTALALGREPKHRDDLERAPRIAAQRLARHGFEAADFYAAWDRGVLGARVLLRQIDAHLTRRTLG